MRDLAQVHGLLVLILSLLIAEVNKRPQKEAESDQEWVEVYLQRQHR